MIIKPTKDTWNISVDGIDINVLSIQAWFLINRSSEGSIGVLTDIIEGARAHEWEEYSDNSNQQTAKDLAKRLRNNTPRKHKDSDIQNFIKNLLSTEGGRIHALYPGGKDSTVTNKNYFQRFKNDNLGNWKGKRYKQKYCQRLYLLARYVAAHDPDSSLGILLQSEQENFGLLRNGFKSITPDNEHRVIDNQISKHHRDLMKGYYRILRPSWKSGCQILTHPFIATLVKISEIEHSPYMTMQEIQAAPGAGNGNPHVEIDWGYFMRRETDLLSLSASNQNATKVWCFCTVKPGLNTNQLTTEVTGEMFSLKSIPDETLAWPFYMQRVDQNIADKLEGGIWQELLDAVHRSKESTKREAFDSIQKVAESLRINKIRGDQPESDQLIQLNHMGAAQLPTDAAHYFFIQAHARLKSLQSWGSSLNELKKSQHNELHKDFGV